MGGLRKVNLDTSETIVIIIHLTVTNKFLGSDKGYKRSLEGILVNFIVLLILQIIRKHLLNKVNHHLYQISKQ